MIFRRNHLAMPGRTIPAHNAGKFFLTPFSRRLGLIAAIISVASGVAMAEGGAHARKLVAEANRAYDGGEVAKALEGYKQAEVTMPELPELAYNRAAAHYKLGEYVQAREYFNRSLATRDLGLEAKAKFNLGNVAYASALEKLASLQEAIDLLKGAIGHYRDALEINSQDGDARANIEMAQLLIKDLLDKLKNQQEEQQQDQQQEGQDQKQQDESQQDQQQQGEDQQDEEQKGDQPQDQQEGDQEQEQQQPEAGDQDEQQEPQQADGEMTKDEAERLLQSVRDRERQRREEQAQRRRRAPRRRVIKDW